MCRLRRVVQLRRMSQNWTDRMHCNTILRYFFKSRSWKHFNRPRLKIVISHTPMWYSELFARLTFRANLNSPKVVRVFPRYRSSGNKAEKCLNHTSGRCFVLSQTQITDTDNRHSFRHFFSFLSFYVLSVLSCICPRRICSCKTSQKALEILF